MLVLCITTLAIVNGVNTENKTKKQLKQLQPTAGAFFHHLFVSVCISISDVSCMTEHLSPMFYSGPDTGGAFQEIRKANYTNFYAEND